MVREAEFMLSGISLGLLNKAVEASSCGVSIADASKKDMPLVYVNSRFEILTGYSREEILGMNCRFLQGPDHDQEEVKEISIAIGNRQDCTVALKNYRKDGSLFFNELHLSPVFDTSGELTHYVGIQTDISERIKFQTRLQQYRENLEHQVEERTRELQDKNIALQELLSQFEIEKRKLRDQTTQNVDAVIVPLLLKLRSKLNPRDQVIVDLLKQSLLDLTSPYGDRITRQLYRLSPREIEICTLICNGLSTKEISGFFNVSVSTVENQRNTIRKKLGLSGTAVNLTSFLLSLSR